MRGAAATPRPVAAAGGAPRSPKAVQRRTKSMCIITDAKIMRVEHMEGLGASCIATEDRRGRSDRWRQASDSGAEWRESEGVRGGRSGVTE